MDLHGVGVGRGVVVGTVRRMPDPLPNLPTCRSGGPGAEFATVVAAEPRGAGLTAAARGPAARRRRPRRRGDDGPGPEPDSSRSPRIEAGATGERAVFEAFAGFQATLEALGGRSAERATDLADVAQRVIAHLRGVPAPGVPVPSIRSSSSAADLAPADTVLLDPASVLGLITRDGGPTSHTAMLARAKSMPAIVAVPGALASHDGTVVLLDAAAGVVRVDPSAAERAAARPASVTSAPRRPPPQPGGPARSPTGPPCRCSASSAPRPRPTTPWRSAPRASACSAPSSSSSTPHCAPSVADQQASTGNCCGTSPARRSSCGASTPARTSR